MKISNDIEFTGLKHDLNNAISNLQCFERLFSRLMPHDRKADFGTLKGIIAQLERVLDTLPKGRESECGKNL